MEPDKTSKAHEDVKYASDIIGDWGPVQAKIFFFLSLIYLVAPFQNISMVFYAPKLDFYCQTNNQSLKNTCEYNYNQSLVSCTNFTYDMGVYGRTLTDTFDLVCDRSWYASLTQTIHAVGYGISGVLFGYISDSHGRLFTAKIAIGLEVVMGFVQAFSPNMMVYMISRLFFGMASYGRFLNCYVLLLEWVCTLQLNWI